MATTAPVSLTLSRWSTKIASDCSTADLCTVPSNSSIFICCQCHYVNRPHFTASALHDSDFSSVTCTKSVSRPRKWIDSDTACSSKPNTVAYCNSKNDVTSVSNSKDGVRARSFKSLFGKRSVWRRILFASKKVRSIILLNAITVVYASNIPVIKEVEAITDPSAFTVVRFALSAIPFIPFVLRARDDVHTRNAGFELGLWVSLGYLMQALGLETSDAGRASFISMFTVIVVPLLDGMLGAIVPARTWFGAVMSILGVALLESSGSPPSVCVIALLSAVWYFIGGSLGGTQGSDPSSWTWTMFWDWMVAFPWIPALYTGIFSTGLCLWIEMAAMRDVSATETAIIYGLEPVWGAGFAWFILGERWGATGWLGAALVLVGSLTVQIFGSSSPSNCNEDEKRSKKADQKLELNKQNGFSSSPAAVTSREDVPNLLKK
ncbi:Integral membrane protein DUF6 containing protein [Citrus sinensis]|uniref:Integral membrane protein DUF6 containing protein n=1 Tax=Citrus sinensis TaxID=2711 RepID=A0ACB8NAA3_CITSI|nr:Integral membrane protein DUF6 containing protein [Citrus sinensis]